MRVKVLIEGTITNLISAYTPQTGCEESEKEAFWRTYEDIIRAIPSTEGIIVGGDLNGHVGEVQPEFERVHGGYGYGRANTEGESILRACIVSDMAIVNTFFKKKPEHLITYKSGPHATQIDYLLIRRCNIGKVTNCKVIPGESLTSQHRLLVMDLLFLSKKKVVERHRPRTKWWLLNGSKSVEFRSAIEKIDLQPQTGILPEEQWNRIHKALTTVSKSVLGSTKGGKAMDRETWWWNDNVQEATRHKKARFLKWQGTNTSEDRAEYIKAKHHAKKAVAKARNLHLAPLYEKLETDEGRKIIYRLAKAREKAAQDITKCLCVRDASGNLVHDTARVKDRWFEYFSELLNRENTFSQCAELPPNVGLVASIQADEVIKCLRRMKNRKAVGPDNVPIEAWKSMGPRGVCLLTDLFNRILDSRKMPNLWRNSYITPVYKGKGSVQECGSYRGIKVMCHTMKLFERVIEGRLRQECNISECQYGFRPGYGTTDPIFALRSLIEAYRERNRSLHVGFLDLQKAFDCVPRQVIWWALRSKNIPEVYIDIIKDMYYDSMSLVKTAVGDTNPFPVTVGVHQGSALSPFLFSVVLDVVTTYVQMPAPWVMMYADDIALVQEDRLSLEQAINRWKDALENGGLKLNVAKTEYLVCGNMDSDSISVGCEEVATSEKFKYLGSVLHSSGGIDHDVKARISAAWGKWREVTGVLCDKKMPLKLKGLIYKSIIRPVLLYGSETWPTLQRHVQELHVTEMKMLRWMCDVTKHDRIRNEHIRGSLHVREVADKLQESRLRWYGHVMRRPADYIGNKCLDLVVTGARPRGRPKRRWFDVLKDDMRANNLTTNDAKDRAKWKRNSSKADPGY